MAQTLLIPLILTLLMHMLIVAAFALQWSDSSLQIKKPAPKFIRAELVTLDKPAAKPKSRQAQKPKVKPKASAKTEPVRQSKPKASPKKETQPKVDQQALREQAEREQQRQRELEQQRREELERELADSIAAEEQLQQAQSEAELAASYIGLISEAIQNSWNRPPSARNGMQAELVIQLIPTGEVVSVRIVKGSGNAEFDRSAEAAVLKAGRFEALQKVPNEMFEQYFRRLRLIFRPEDLRL